MRYHFCTLFDRNYLYKGLALYQSLVDNCGHFTLWVLCMDDDTYSTLNKLKLEKIKLISLSEFEDEELLRVKSSRTPKEYCWTCTSSLLFYLLIKWPRLEMITYLDADLFFFSDPLPLFHELGGSSILLSRHNYSPPHKHYSETSGIYCVQFMTFRNNADGLEALRWWREKCLEWCYARFEDGRFGDQKYLDDWTTRFRGVHVLQHNGAGVALWNMLNYKVSQIDRKIFIDNEPLIFYHFHNFSILGRRSYDFGDTAHYSNNLSRESVRYIYNPYVREIGKSIKIVKKVDPEFNFGYSAARQDTFRDRILTILKTTMDRVIAMVNAKAGGG